MQKGIDRKVDVEAFAAHLRRDGICVNARQEFRQIRRRERRTPGSIGKGRKGCRRHAVQFHEGYDRNRSARKTGNEHEQPKMSRATRCSCIVFLH